MRNREDIRDNLKEELASMLALKALGSLFEKMEKEKIDFSDNEESEIAKQEEFKYKPCRSEDIEEETVCFEEMMEMFKEGINVQAAGKRFVYPNKNGNIIFKNKKGKRFICEDGLLIDLENDTQVSATLEIFTDDYVLDQETVMRINEHIERMTNIDKYQKDKNASTSLKERTVYEGYQALEMIMEEECERMFFSVAMFDNIFTGTFRISNGIPSYKIDQSIVMGSPEMVLLNALINGEWAKDMHDLIKESERLSM